MPGPLLAVAGAWLLALLRAASIILSAKELVDTLGDFYEGLDKYNKGVEEAKKLIEERIEKLKKEIDGMISEKEQVGILLAGEATDPQSQKTQQGRGRGGDNSAVIKVAIQQKIPFRRVISEVCEKASDNAIWQVRKKKGVTIDDIKGAKRKALEELLRQGIEGLSGEEFDMLIAVRLKQLTASLMFEFIDYCLDWASPLKAEVTFGPKKSGYTDHPVEGATQLKRVGKVSPFYPFPPPNNRRGSIAADLVINEYRKERTDKNNIFAIVEIKFEGDKIEEEQFQKYAALLDESADVKTQKSPVRYNGQPVSSGGRLALFRYPEDKPRAETEEEKKQQKADKPADKPAKEKKDKSVGKVGKGL